MDIVFMGVKVHAAFFIKSIKILNSQILWTGNSTSGNLPYTHTYKSNRMYTHEYSWQYCLYKEKS